MKKNPPQYINIEEIQPAERWNVKAKLLKLEKPV